MKLNSLPTHQVVGNTILMLNTGRENIKWWRDHRIDAKHTSLKQVMAETPHGN